MNHINLVKSSSTVIVCQRDSCCSEREHCGLKMTATRKEKTCFLGLIKKSVYLIYVYARCDDQCFNWSICLTGKVVCVRRALMQRIPMPQNERFRWQIFDESYRSYSERAKWTAVLPKLNVTSKMNGWLVVLGAERENYEPWLLGPRDWIISWIREIARSPRGHRKSEPTWSRRRHLSSRVSVATREERGPVASCIFTGVIS